MPSTTEAEPIVLAQNLRKAFGAFDALRDLSLHIQPGECFGLLGPNGAGKSTLIKLLYGLTKRTSGDLRVLGFDPSRDARILKHHVGVVMQEDALDEAMSVRENMMMFCWYHGIWGKTAEKLVDELLEFMGLTAKAQAHIITLSGGMKRRLAFVRSLIPRPRLLILDEPTTGLDPAVRQLLWQKIRTLKRRGTTIILTTHYMDEAELLCDRLVLIDGGVIREEGTPCQLVEKHMTGPVLLDFDQGHDQAQKFRDPNLEDVFIKLTGRDLNV